jgi:hypothetical protein
MRPNIEITHTLNGRVKDYAAEEGLDLPEAYRRIIETGLEELERRDEASEDQPDTRTVDHDDTPTREEPDETDDRINEIVATVSESWDDTPERLEARREAARAALGLAVRRGSLSKSDAVDDVFPNHAVDNQTEETWWRKNVRPVLQHAGTHAPGRGYSVDLNRNE